MHFSRHFSALSGLFLIFNSVSAQEIRHLETELPSGVSETHAIAVSTPAVINAFEFSLYPNPAHSVVYYRLPVLPDGEGTLSLIDSAGNNILQKEFKLQIRSGSIQLPEFIPPGKYTLRFASEYGVSQSRLIVCGY